MSEFELLIFSEKNVYLLPKTKEKSQLFEIPRCWCSRVTLTSGVTLSSSQQGVT